MSEPLHIKHEDSDYYFKPGTIIGITVIEHPYLEGEKDVFVSQGSASGTYLSGVSPDIIEALLAALREEV